VTIALVDHLGRFRGGGKLPLNELGGLLGIWSRFVDLLFKYLMIALHGNYEL